MTLPYDVARCEGVSYFFQQRINGQDKAINILCTDCLRRTVAGHPEYQTYVVPAMKDGDCPNKISAEDRCA